MEGCEIGAVEIDSSAPPHQRLAALGLLGIEGHPIPRHPFERRLQPVLGKGQQDGAK